MPHPDYGDPNPVPLKDLVPHDQICAALTAKGQMFELEERTVKGVLQKVWKNTPPSLAAFWKASSSSWGPRTYIVYQDTRLTFTQVDQQATRLAHSLRSAYQVRKGDRVGIIARNLPEFVISYWAIHMCGAVAVLVNAFSDAETLAFCVDDVQCRVIITDVERYLALKPSIPALTKGELQGVIVIPHKGKATVPPAQRAWLGDPSVAGWDELQQTWGDPPKHASPAMNLDPESNALILFTSGTSGRPKGVLSTQRQVLSTLLNSAWYGAYTFLRRRRPVPAPTNPGLDERAGSNLLLVPLFHATGQSTCMGAGVLGGSKVVLLPSYSVEEAGRAIERERVKGITGIGFMIQELLSSKSDLSSLHTLAHGGAAASSSIPGQAARNGSIPSNGYGLTEVNAVALLIAGDDYAHRPTSAGRPPPTIDVRIVDPDTLVSLPCGQVGELWIKSPARATGYWNRPKENAEAFLQDGWFRSGDLCKQDEEGFVYILDRAKDIIIRKGENISCAAVEDAVYKGEPRIVACAAVAVKDKDLGEKVAIVCVPSESARSSNNRPTEADVRKAAQATLPKFMVPEHIWIRDEPLPRNAPGKVVKAVLRQEVAKHVAEQGGPKAKL